ncbi:YbfB/YjiJ family MFS transporter, partial [Dactylosporangium sp. NPDC049140]|uniref:YbfB/YjiJ family MFS transporter n=1 Tax=Dactylosporangium sp. NPDC049140 TaxID=3155647 RepID=UPI0033FF694B
MSGPMRRLALGSATAIGLGRFAYGLVLPAMAGNLGWSFGTAATLAVANGVGYLAGALATPGAERRWGPRAVFRAGMVLCTVSLAATAVTGDEYAVVLSARAVTGFAGALVFVSGAVLAPGRGFFAGAGLGVAAAGAVLPPLLAGDVGRWPLAWLYLAVVAAVCTAGSWRMAEGSRPKEPEMSAPPVPPGPSVPRVRSGPFVPSGPLVP